MFLPLNILGVASFFAKNVKDVPSEGLNKLF